MTLSKIAQKLDDARRDVAKLTRLQEARNRLASVEIEYDAAMAQADADAAAKAVAAREALMAGIVDVTVRDSSSATAGNGLLSRAFDITTTRPVYDYDTRTSPLKPTTVRGFHAQPGGVMLFLMEKRPENIPAAIMALAPDNPSLAFQRYAIGRQRGHL
jgi:multidrug efflux pump subunit AcrA (membrane-fusion protein)